MAQRVPVCSATPRERNGQDGQGRGFRDHADMPLVGRFAFCMAGCGQNAVLAWGRRPSWDGTVAEQTVQSRVSGVGELEQVRDMDGAGRSDRHNSQPTAHSP